MPKLKAICLTGGPGTGKSTTAAHLFALMKQRGKRVELVHEFARELVNANSFDLLNNQLYVLGEQDRRQRVCHPAYEYIITDSPLYLGMVYCNEEYAPLLASVLPAAMDRYENYHIWLNRVKPYVKLGRYQNEEEARMADLKIYPFFLQFAGAPGWSMEVDGDEWAAERIYDFIFPAEAAAIAKSVEARKLAAE